MSFPKQKKPRSWRVLQDWIRHYADQEELPQSRVRRAVSFMLVALPLDRSLDEEGNPRFLIKGGASMELRLGVGARTTKDIDVVFRGTPREMLDALEEAFAQPYGSFSFRRKGRSRTSAKRVVAGSSYRSASPARTGRPCRFAPGYGRRSWTSQGRVSIRSMISGSPVNSTAPSEAASATAKQSASAIG